MSRFLAPPLSLRLETSLACSAEAAWRAECRIGHLLAVSRPLIVFSLDDPGLAECAWQRGQVLELRGRAFGLLPLGRQRVEVVRLDPARREIETEEAGGPVRRWRHRVRISPVSAQGCRYRDDILIDAGALTAPLWLLAWLVYRWRQVRRRRLAAEVMAGPQA